MIKINHTQNRLSFVVTGFNHKITDAVEEVLIVAKKAINNTMTDNQLKRLMNQFRFMLIRKLVSNRGVNHNSLLKINRFRIMTVGKFDPLKVLT